MRGFLLGCIVMALFFAGAAHAESYSPTPDQKARLDQFGYDVFQTSLPGLENQSGEVSPKLLVARFGQPLRRVLALGRYGDGFPGDSTVIHWTTWYFRGLAFAMSRLPRRHHGVGNADLVVVGVSVTSPAYILKYGLHVGETRARFFRVLGPPTYEGHGRVQYDVENAARIAPDDYEIEPYQIEMDLDHRDRVRRIVWSWWSD